AADLFSKTFESVGKKRAALVAVGNANYCMALSSGLQFKQSSKLEDYTSAKTRLSEAAEDYSKAGFETAAQWFRATDRTLDAYVYMNNALKEVEPEKRTKNYLAAEKVLESAASIYENAGYPAKRDDILSVLKKVREEKEFTMS